MDSRQSNRWHSVSSELVFRGPLRIPEWCWQGALDTLTAAGPCIGGPSADDGSGIALHQRIWEVIVEITVEYLMPAARQWESKLVAVVVNR